MYKKYVAVSINWFLPFGSIGLFGWAFIESSFFPIPPDVLLMVLCFKQPLLSFWFAFVCTLGSIFGAVFGYYIGKLGGRPLMNKIISRDKILSAEKYYIKYDVWAVAIAGFTPIPYKVFTITSGVFNMNFRRFIIASVLSRGARFFIVAGFIYIFGDTIKPFINKYFEYITILIILLLVGGFYVLKFNTKPKLAKKEGEQSELSGSL